MKTNIAYQDDLDIEECEVYIDGAGVQHLPSVGEAVVVASQDDDETPGVLHVVKERLWTVFPEAEGCPAVQHVTVLLDRVEPKATVENASKSVVVDDENDSISDRVDKMIARAFTTLHLSSPGGQSDNVITIAELRDDVRRLLESHARDVVDTLIADLSDRRGLKSEWNRIDEDVREEIRASWLLLVRGAVKP